MKEKSDFKKLPVLLKHKSGVIHFIDSTPTSWKYLIKHYVKWVYIRDLLPMRKNNNNKRYRNKRK